LYLDSESDTWLGERFLDSESYQLMDLGEVKYFGRLGLGELG
jgi:hypothetical protein